MFTSNQHMDQKEELCYIEKVKNGEANYFSYLVESYKDIVYSISLKILKDHDEAEDLAQESFIKAYNSILSFQGKSKFSSWLYRITYNTCISHVRKKKQEYISVDDIQIKDEAEDFNFDEIPGDARKKYLQQALKQLPEIDYTLVLLYYFEELSVDEIKKIVNMSASNVKVKIHRARKKLYTIIEDKLKQEIYT